MKNLHMYLNHFCKNLRPKGQICRALLFGGGLVLASHAYAADPGPIPAQLPTDVESLSAKSELSPYQTAVAGPSEKANPFLDALVSAYMTNSELRSKVEQQKSKDEQVSRNLSAFRPNLGITANTGVSRTENQTRERAGKDTDGQTIRTHRDRVTTHPSNAGLSLTQSLYNGGSDVAKVDSSENLAIAGQYDYLNTEQKTLIEAIAAYMNVIFTEKAIEVNKSTENFLKEQLEGMKVQVEVGEKTLTDQALAESRLAEATAGVYDAEGKFEKAVAKYETVIGTKPGLLIQPKPLQGLPASREDLINIAKDTNPRILQAIYVEKSAKNDIDAASGALLPKVDVQGDAGRHLQRSTTKDRSNSASAIVRLTIPLYQGGGEWATIRQNAFAAAQARYDLEQARKQAVEAAIDAWTTWEFAKKKIESFLVQIKAAERSRDGALLEAEVGERSYLEVLDSQKDLLRAQLGLLEAMRDEFVAQYQVLVVVGLLTARYLQLPVQVYDIAGHLEEAKSKFVGT